MCLIPNDTFPVCNAQTIISATSNAYAQTPYGDPSETTQGPQHLPVNPVRIPIHTTNSSENARNPGNCIPIPTHRMPMSPQVLNIPSRNHHLPNFLLANVRSIASKIDELSAVIIVNHVEMVCITESWLSPLIPSTAISLSDFILFRKDRLRSTGGGVCAYIKNSIFCKRLTEFESPTIESLWLLIRPSWLPRQFSVILLAVIYHSTSSGRPENDELYAHIQSNVDSFLQRHPEALVLVTGDFNSKSTGFNEKFVQRSTGLFQVIKVATRNNAILDWCLTNVKNHNYESIQLPPIGSSDHNTILMKAHNRPVKPDNTSVWKRDLRDSKLRPFGQWITAFDWSVIFDTLNCEDKYEKFNSIISEKIDQFFPLHRSKVRKCDKPWMTSSIKLLIAKRQNALRHHGKNSVMYKYWRSKVQSNINLARKRFYANSVEKLKNSNPSKWWKEIKAIGGLSSKNSWYHQLLSDAVPTPCDLAEEINNFLIGLTSHFHPILPDNGLAAFSIPNEYLVDDLQVYSELQKIKTTKSSGPDGVPNKILKTFAYELAPVIRDLYNTSMMEGSFPQRLKRSVVVPIPKVSPPLSIQEDIRPISLTSQIAKVMEGFTLENLFLQIANKLDNKQFALPKKSTTHALVYLLHSILAAFEKGSCSARLFFADFKKGFDLVDHNIIVKELENLGVHPATIRWIKAFLYGREQCVRVENTFSSWKKSNGGLPQGTRLGPLLFAVLVNSLLRDWSGRIKFVDDATALEIVPRCSPSLLPLVVKEISDFANDRGMKLNPKKCKEMAINPLKYKLSIDNAITVAGKLVECVTCFKLLGVWISDDLTWNVHVDSILKKANSRLYALRLLKRAGLHPSDIIQIYCSFIRSQIEYASPVWSSLPKFLSDILESVQKRALRIVYPSLSYLKALEISNLQTLSCRREEACKKFVLSLRHENSPSNPLAEIVKIRPRVDPHSYNLRNNTTNHLPVMSNRFENFVTVKYF